MMKGMASGAMPNLPGMPGMAGMSARAAERLAERRRPVAAGPARDRCRRGARFRHAVPADGRRRRRCPRAFPGLPGAGPPARPGGQTSTRATKKKKKGGRVTPPKGR